VNGLILFLNLVLEGIVTGLVYALIALGFSLIWRVCDVIHIAHGGVLLIAAAAIFVVHRAGLPFFAAIVAGAIAATVAGLLIEEGFYRPMRNWGASEFGMITVSLGILIVIQYGIVIMLGPDDMSVSAPSLREPLVAGLPVTFDRFSITTLGLVAGLFILCALLFNRTAMGRSMRALASNEQLASIIGLDTEGARRKAIIVGSLMTVPAAALMLVNNGILPTDGLHIILVAATVSIIGGRGSLAGALLGGLLIGLAESLMVWHFPYGWRQVITFVPLYLLLLVRPQGLFGGRA